MSSAAQTAANIANAQSSTGPRTETGKAASSKNSVVFGLFSGDFIRPHEEQAYSVLHFELLGDLAPVGVLEDVLVEEIQRAMWRLRRCGEVESHLVIRLDEDKGYILDPMETFDARAEAIQKSVDRARAQAHRLLHKSTAELRKLQTERQIAVTKQTQSDASTPKPHMPVTKQPQSEAPTPEPDMPVTKQSQSQPVEMPRSAQCPCGSGRKYKRCCGRNAPAMLHAA